VDRRMFDLKLGLPLAGLALLVGSAPISAQNADRDELSAVPQAIVTEDYIEPPAHIAAAVLAQTESRVSLNNGDPSNTWFLQTVSDGLPTLASFAKPHLNLGAWQIDPAAQRNRRLTTRNSAGYQLVHRDGERTIDIEPPRLAWTYDRDVTMMRFPRGRIDGHAVREMYEQSVDVLQTQNVRLLSSEPDAADHEKAAPAAAVAPANPGGPARDRAALEGLPLRRPGRAGPAGHQRGRGALRARPDLQAHARRGSAPGAAGAAGNAAALAPGVRCLGRPCGGRAPW